MSATFKQDGDVSLRPLEKEDAEFLQQLIVSPDVRKYLGRTPMPRNLDKVEDRVESVTGDDSIIQFIIEEDGEPAGTIALFDIDRDYRHAEFGAFMVKPDMHSEGVGTKALEMLLEYAFDEL
ncbi:MAG: GNAT family N-acetyltransferase, partial [Candidatus Nanohaloarchaea archaeon]